MAVASSAPGLFLISGCSLVCISFSPSHPGVQAARIEQAVRIESLLYPQMQLFLQLRPGMEYFAMPITTAIQYGLAAQLVGDCFLGSQVTVTRLPAL